MPANSTHPDYDTNLKVWKRARHLFGGASAVKAHSNCHLFAADHSETQILSNKNLPYATYDGRHPTSASVEDRGVI